MIASWIKDGRTMGDVPINDLEGFEREWLAWWSELKPKGILSDETNWACLLKRGKSGFICVMMALAWWGLSSKCDDSWRSAMGEVTQALRWGLLPAKDDQGSTRAKRKRTEENDSQPVRSTRSKK